MARKDEYESLREEALRKAQEKASAHIGVPEADANINYIYLNPAQKAVYNYRARSTTVEAGRGTGKTDGLIAPYMIGDQDRTQGACSHRAHDGLA